MRSNTDTIGFEKLIHDYGGLIYRIASTYERRPALIDELVQDAAFAIWKAVPHLQNQDNLKAYIARITHNICISHVRRAVRRPETELQDVYIDEAPQPDEVTGQNLMRQRLYAAIFKLGLVERQIIGLYLEGFSQKESSEILGLKPNHIGVKLTRIRQKLKALMEPSQTDNSYD